MLFLNGNEEKVIGRFIQYSKKYDTLMLLRWKNFGEIIAKFDSFMEDENDFEPEEKGYEEFWSLLFNAYRVIGTPPVQISECDDFIINYHNFPDEIIVDGKKIN